MRRRIRAWGRRQLYSFFSSLGTLLSHRVGTLMTVLVLGIAMALPLGLYVTVTNLRGLDLQQDEWGAITVFLSSNTTQRDALELARTIDERPDAAVTTVSPEEGIQQFREVSGFGQALDAFETNPLPWVLLVSPTVETDDDLQTVVHSLGTWLEARDHVDQVLVDHKWLQRLAGLLELGDAFVTVLTALFSMAVIVVVANTIRLDVAGRAEEILVLNLVGAGNSFIRQPFLYSGFWYGILGAIMALILLGLTIFYLQNPLEQLLDAYGNRFQISGLDGVEMVVLVLAGGVLGSLGAGLSVQRYLRLIRVQGTLGRL
jgi:cell division transport system permease protein